METLKELRRLAGWTQMRTSHKSGVNRAKLSMAECGEISLSIQEETAIRLALLQAIRHRAEQIGRVIAGAQK